MKATCRHSQARTYLRTTIHGYFAPPQQRFVVHMMFLTLFLLNLYCYFLCLLTAVVAVP